MYLDLSRGDEEPLRDAGVNRLRGIPGSLRDVGVERVVGGDFAGGALDGDVGDGQVVRGRFGGDFTRDETAPSFVAFVNYLRRVLLVLGFTREGECIFGLSIGDLVDPEPLICGSDETREMPLDILNVVQLWGQGVIDIDYNDLPVGLAFIEEGHDAKNFNLLDLTNVAKLLADLADIQRVVVTASFGLGVGLVGVFPRLRESTIVPDVTMVGEAIANVTQSALFDILFDGVKGLFFTDLHLGVGPAGNLDDHVENAVVLVGEERDVVPWADGGLSRGRFKVNAVLKGVGRSYRTRIVLWWSPLASGLVGHVCCAGRYAR